MKARVAARKRGILAAPFVAFLVLAGCNAISGVGDLVVDSSLDSGVEEPDGDAASADDGDVISPPEEDADDAGDVGDAEEPVDAIGDEDATPHPPKRVFVTSSSSTGNIGGLEGADERCNTLAKSAGLDGTWLAWLSTPNVNAIDRLPHLGSYELLDGTVVVTSKQQLTSGRIEHAIDMTENKERLTKNRGVWTGTRGNGTADATCNGWTTDSALVLGTLASAIASDVGWTKGAPQGGHPDNWECNTVVGLYCFER